MAHAPLLEPLVASTLAFCAAFTTSLAAMQTTTTMKAVRLHEFGTADVLKYEDAPVPLPNVSEALVRVHAAGVNPVDWKMREGAYRTLDKDSAITLGFDISGVVESVGTDVERFRPGDEVFGYLSLKRGGGYAEYVAALASELADKPSSVDHIHAAGVPLAALTAWQALFDRAGLSAGQTVLIHAGAGGVGHFAIQLAKVKGARVIATSSTRNARFLRELGADHVVDYEHERFEHVARAVDVVLDSVGGDTLKRSYAVVAKGGFVVSIVEEPDTARLAEQGLRGSVMLVEPNATQLAEIAELIDAGQVTPVVSEIMPLAEARRAHALSATGHTRGKIVLQVVR